MTGPLVPPGPLTHGTELNAVYAIARIVAETYDTEAGLDAVFRLSRTIFIFDVVSLFLHNEDTGQLEPSYPLALGRGRLRPLWRALVSAGAHPIGRVRRLARGPTTGKPPHGSPHRHPGSPARAGAHAGRVHLHHFARTAPPPGVHHGLPATPD